MSVKRKGLDWLRRLEDEVFEKSNELFGRICEIELNYFVGSSPCQRRKKLLEHVGDSLARSACGGVGNRPHGMFPVHWPLVLEQVYL